MASLHEKYGIDFSKMLNKELVEFRKELMHELDTRRSIKAIERGKIKFEFEKFYDKCIACLDLDPVDLRRGIFKFRGKIQLQLIPNQSSVSINSRSNSDLLKKILKIDKSPTDSVESFAKKLDEGIKEAVNLIKAESIING